MKTPKRLQPLVEDGLIEEVIRPLMSGKEASVLVVRSGGEVRCAKVYKEAKHRSFRKRADYEEGRSVRNTRRARAMAKRSKFGRSELEDAWQNTEVDTIYRLARAGVRVPKPHVFSDGVLIMELITDASGHAAPRLNDIRLTADTARNYHAFLLNQIVRMLCEGLIHGDLSEYNVLVDAKGPVVIDFPQAVDAAGNQSAKRMLLRDVDNMRRYFSRYAPSLKRSQYGKEIWRLYERGELHPETELTGEIVENEAQANVQNVLREIEDARTEHHRRFGRQVIDISDSATRDTLGEPPPPRRRPPRRAGAANTQDRNGPQKRRRRRRRGKSGDARPTSAAQATTTGQGSEQRSRHGQADAKSGNRSHPRGRSKPKLNSSPKSGRDTARKPDADRSHPPREARQGTETKAGPVDKPAPKKRRRRRRRRKPNQGNSTATAPARQKTG